MGWSGNLKCYCGMVGVPLCRVCKAEREATDVVTDTPDSATDNAIGAERST